MDSREAQSQPVPPGMMMGPNSYTPNIPNNNNSSMISPNSAANMMPNPRFPFNSVISGSSKPFDSLNNNNTNNHNNSSSQYDGSGGSGLVPCGFNMDQQQLQQQGKKKRGRPRKYSPDGGSNIALGLSPTPISPMGHEDCGSGGGGGAAGGLPSSEPSAKRNRGRPPGSGKKQLDALGPGGVGFTPHVITIQPGEDISSKIMAFSQEGPRTVCILSANGAICNVTLRQPAVSGGTVTYEGRFEIISLSGSFFLSESNGNRSRNGGLSISLASSDGRVLGGGVAGMLVAATPVQVIVGSFVAEGKKSNSNISASTPSSAAPPQMLNFGAPVAAASPPSHGGSSDSSDENGSSPLDRAGFGPYNNANQPIHSMPLYPSMNWGPPGMKIHPN